MWFLFVFLIVPLLEIKLLVWAAGQIGVVPVILLCVLSTVIGTAMVRAQGWQALLAMQESIMSREMPVKALFDGVCLALAGVLLIIPGFLTDILGILLLLSPVRSHLYNRLGQPFGDGVEDHRQRQGPPPPHDPAIIEGEFTRLDNKDMS